MNKPYSIKIFLPGGDPDGLRTIEKSNWNGCGLVVPRPLFVEARKRLGLNRPGVYVLVGSPEDSGLPKVYIGEGDPIIKRLQQHASKKDFWIQLIAFTSNKDGNLNKAHVQYLEARLVALAAEAKRCVLDNGNVPQLPTLSEADEADAESFLEEMLLCFPVLGLNIFSKAVTNSRTGPELFLKAKGLETVGVASAQGLVIKKGSRASATTVPSCQTYLKEIRAALFKNGVIVRDGASYRFTQDYAFSSPSTAAGVALGRSSSGRNEWKTKDGRTLKGIQDSEETK